MRRRVVRLAVLLVVLILGAAGGLAVAYPSVAATTCPRCYGLVALQGGLYAESGLPDADQQRLIELYRDAESRVSDFYGGRVSSPKVLACLTASCYDRIGGGQERGIAVLNQAVMLSPRGLDPVIAAHELSHVEFHRRLGEGQARVPQWFDEGLAVLVSDDSRYLRPTGTADRCLAEPDAALPETLATWLEAASADEQVYAKAACRVSRWVDAHGGPPAVLDLIAHLERGAPLTSPPPGMQYIACRFPQPVASSPGRCSARTPTARSVTR